MSYPTISLAEKVAQLGAESWPIIAAGYFVALLAVTGAAAGFSESLGDRFARPGARTTNTPFLSHRPP